MRPLRHDVSSDLGDTALCYQMTQAHDIIIEDVRRLGAICKRRALEFRDTLCVGRTHGIHAEPMTFGMKWATWAWALKRAEQRLFATREVLVRVGRDLRRRRHLLQHRPVRRERTSARSSA